MELLELSALTLGGKIKKREISVAEATREALKRIEEQEPEINAFVTVDGEGALRQAEEIQKGIDRGSLTGPLAGVPAAVKDNLCTKGLRTTCSSKILYNFVPAYTAEAV